MDYPKLREIEIKEDETLRVLIGPHDAYEIPYNNLVKILLSDTAQSMAVKGGCANGIKKDHFSWSEPYW